MSTIEEDEKQSYLLGIVELVADIPPSLEGENEAGTIKPEKEVKENVTENSEPEKPKKD